MITDTIYDAYGMVHILPGLYDDFPQFFRLQEYYPNGGLGESLEIAEPEGWDAIKFLLKRNPDWHGVSSEYSSEGVEFDGNSGREFIEGIFRSKGEDATITLQRGTKNGATFIVEYEGRLDFNIRNSQDRKTSVGLERKSLESKMMARWDSAFTIGGTQRLPLLPQALTEKFDCAVKSGKKVEQVIQGDSNGGFWLQFDTSQPTTADIQEFAGGQIMGISESDPVGNELWKFKFRSSGVFKVSIALTYRHWWTVKKRAISIGAARITRYNVKTLLVHLKANGQRQEYNITEPLSSNNNGTTEVLLVPKGTLEKDLDVSAGDKLFIYGSTTFSHNKNELQSVQIESSILTQRITITGQSRNSPTSAAATTLYDVLDAGIAKATDLFDRLRSPYYGLQGALYPVSGPGSERLVFNGFAARNFKENEHPISTTLQDTLVSCKALDGIGISFGTEVNEFDVPIDTVIIQPARDFYRPIELLRLDKVIDYREETILTELISTVEIGYEKYVQEGTNALEEVHTTHQLTTPVRNAEGKLSFLSKFVASTLAIERTRREQFAETPKDGTDFDEDIFIVQCKPTTTYNGPISLIRDAFAGYCIVQVPEVIEWITPGMVVFLFGSVSNDYPYEVTYVSDAARKPWTFYVKGGDVFVEETVANGQIKPSQLSLLTPETGADLYDVKGIAADDTAFNLRLTPGRLLYKTLPFWAGCLRYKEPDEEVYKSKIPQNKSLMTVIEGERPLRVTERQAVAVDEIAPLLVYGPEKISFTVRLNRAQVQRLRLGQSGILPIETDDKGEPVNRNYGYVSLLDTDGIRVAGYLDSLEWSDTDEMATFELHRTALDLNDTSSGLDCAQFKGWTLEEAENADDRTRRRIELCTYVSVDVL